MVGKDELLAAVWPDAVVTEDSLVQCVKEIRQALGAQKKTLLRTMPRLGYALVASRSDEAQARSLQPTPEVRYCRSRDGTRLAVARYGSGPPVVRAGNYSSQIGLDAGDPLLVNYLNALTAGGRSYVAFDQRGSGHSDRQVADISFEAWVADLEAVVASLGEPRVTLFGQSQGAAIAVAFAARHPERVERLVLHGSYARHRFNSGDPSVREQAQTLIEVARVGWQSHNDEFRSVFVSVLQRGAPLALQRRISQRLMESFDSATAARYFTTIFAIDVRELAPLVACPTLVTHFADDQSAPMALGAEMAALIPNARFVCMPGSGHMLWETGPGSRAFAETVSRFFAEPV